MYFIRIFCFLSHCLFFVLYYAVPFLFCYYFSSYPSILFLVAFLCTLSCCLFSYSLCLVLFTSRSLSFVLEFLKYFGAFLIVSVFVPTKIPDDDLIKVKTCSIFKY
jgi:hypothetical protein